MSKSLAKRILHSEYEPWTKRWLVNDDNYCGCPDCNDIVGQGDTEVLAIINYWEKVDESNS
jgi:hypothetical protein